MQIGEVIRKYRKEKNMTQEDLASRLGVTTPAVNKWEKGNTFPDIMILAPIARLLGISLDTLLSYQEELTEEEINAMIIELDRLVKVDYHKAFEWLNKKIETYPNCEKLLIRGTMVMDIARLVRDFPKNHTYEDIILKHYKRALESEDYEIRDLAADAMFGFYLRKEAYEQAEQCLPYLSSHHPDKRRKQAVIYRHTNRKEEAYKICEEILFENVNKGCLILNELFTMALEEKDIQRATVLVGKQKELIRVFEMGKYREIGAGFELAVYKKDVEGTLNSMKGVIESIEDICGFMKSDLYRHMTFNPPKESFLVELREELIENFKDTATYGYLKEDQRWKDLIGL